jgi:hypothetical protein
LKFQGMFIGNRGSVKQADKGYAQGEQWQRKAYHRRA